MVLAASINNMEILLSFEPLTLILLRHPNVKKDGESCEERPTVPVVLVRFEHLRHPAALGCRHVCIHKPAQHDHGFRWVHCLLNVKRQ